MKVANWSEFQHYKTRNPPWIKLHKRILDNPEFARLPVESRAIAPMLWLIASESEEGGSLPPVEDIAWRLRMSATDVRVAIQPLIDLKFVEAPAGVASVDASSVQASCTATRCTSREETETETETERETEAPPAREADDEAANLGRELLAILEEAKRVTGRDGQTILADKRVRPSKGLPITNPLACSPPAVKLWRVTIDRVKGYIAAYKADKGGKTFGRGWDSASDEPEEFQAAREWIRDHWPDDASPESRDALTAEIRAAGCPEEVVPAVVCILLPRFPQLYVAAHAARLQSGPITARPKNAVTIAEPPKACGECNGPLTHSGGVYSCADGHGLGCEWTAVVESARVA